MSVNNYRKCAKCARTRIDDMTVTYHRFPKPGSSNIMKARAWAKYCWPDQDWTSTESLHTLHSTFKVLCGRHFRSIQFLDNERKKLSKFAVPDSTEVEELLNSRENVCNKNDEHASVTKQTSSQSPLAQINNNMHKPATSASSQTLNEVQNTKKKMVQAGETDTSVPPGLADFQLPTAPLSPQPPLGQPPVWSGVCETEIEIIEDHNYADISSTSHTPEIQQPSRPKRRKLQDPATIFAEAEKNARESQRELNIQWLQLERERLQIEADRVRIEGERVRIEGERVSSEERRHRESIQVEADRVQSQIQLTETLKNLTNVLEKIANKY